jgi:outer membrane protein assembly factor BamB
LIAALLVSVGCSKKFKMHRESLAQETNWQFHHQDLESTSNKSGNYDGKLNVIWEESFGTRPSGPLTLAKGFLILPDGKKKIRFYQSADGQYRGFLRTKGHTETGVVVKDSLGYYVDGPRKYVLHCVNLLKRKTLWEHQVKDATSGSIIVDNKIIISLTEGIVLAYDLISGEKQWSFQAQERFVAPLSAFGNTIIQPGDNGSLYMIDAENGEEISTQTLDAPALSSAVASSLIYTVDMDGKITAAVTGKNTEVWNAKVTGPVWSSPAVNEKNIFVTTNTGEIAAFDAATGAQIWKHSVGEVIHSAPIVVGDFVVFGTKSGKLFSLNAGNGDPVASRQLAGSISQNPVSDGTFIYVASDHGELFCLGDSNEIAALGK